MGGADLFGVSLASAKRWLKMKRESGDVGARAIPGPPAVKGAMFSEWLPAHLKNNPDLTLEEYREAFEDAFGVAVSRAMVCRRTARLPGGWPLKKSVP